MIGFRFSIILLIVSVSCFGQVTYDNKPMGSLEEPLVMRSYLPQPGLSDVVLSNHFQASPVSKYSPKKGEDVEGVVQPIHGLPAGIAVNYGAQLSYCWDTTECRLLYAWKEGFLDMESIWGTPKRGTRMGFDYVPRLVGGLSYLAEGFHPITINGEPIAKPMYHGYRKEGPNLTFQWRSNGVMIETSVKPGAVLGEVILSYQTQKGVELGYREMSFAQVTGHAENYLTVILAPQEIEKPLKEESVAFSGVSVERGEDLYLRYGCNACHTVDGSKSHGPTFKGLYGSEREFKDGKGTVDQKYLLESIRQPNAEIALGFQPNYMPHYTFNDDETKSLVEYIKTIK